MDPIEQAYAAPRSVVTTPEARQRPSTAWWLHFALVALAALALWGLAVKQMLTLPGHLPFRALVFLSPLLLTWGAAGLYGYIRGLRVGPRWLWIVYLVVMWLLMLTIGSLQALVVRSGLDGALAADGFGLWFDVARLVLFLVVAVPLLFALGRYVSGYSLLRGRR